MPIPTRSALADHSHLRYAAGLFPVLVALCLALAGCSSAQHAGSAPVKVDGSTTSPGGLDGDRLSPPVKLSAADLSATFQSSVGTSTSLRALETGKLMLLYFGYTHCPDVCPTTMADLGQALGQLPVQLRTHTQIVFVTSDPARDSPAVMKAWLSNFDSGLPTPFIGLTASVRQIDKVATSVGVPLSAPVTEPNGTITVEHGAQTLAFQSGQANVLWLAGTTPAQYAHDITQLLDSGPNT